MSEQETRDRMKRCEDAQRRGETARDVRMFNTNIAILATAPTEED